MILRAGYRNANQIASPTTQWDRTQFPAAVSQNWEYFGMWPETFGSFAPPLVKSGGWRPFAELEKPAVGEHFSDY
jgi:hypothetical protein